jgi:predicted dehydrogenase
MKESNNPSGADLNRRDFLKGSSLATLATLLTIPADQAKATAVGEDGLEAPEVTCAVIGLGFWGRERILPTLDRIPGAQIAAICDNFPPLLRRTARNFPNAEQTDDYRKILANDDIQAVIVATPTHLHKEIVIEALQAGKHVYCEAPLAHTIEDAAAIAQAAKDAHKVTFQAGLQNRSDPQRQFLLDFVRAGALGQTVMARAQWHKKTSWRQLSGVPGREKDANWRLDQETSLGLIGEIGIHQLDMATLFLRAKPEAVTGFGSILHWRDGRDVADTIQSVIEFPGGKNLVYHATLANSFDGEYEVYYGTHAAIMIRDDKAWMFKETDSPLLGWEVYARKDSFHQESGIALVMDATQLAAQGEQNPDSLPPRKDALYHALGNFLYNADQHGGAVEDFSMAFDPNDRPALERHLADLNFLRAAGYKEGYEATVLAIKANESVTSGKRLILPKELLQFV